MRGLVLLACLGGLGVLVWLALRDPATVVAPVDPEVAEDGERGPVSDQTADAVREKQAGREGTSGKTTGNRDASGAADSAGIPVTLLAIAMDAAGNEGNALDGFTFRLTRTAKPGQKNGERPVRGNKKAVAAGEADSGHVLRIGPGHYSLAVRLDGRIAPAPATFEITERSEPLTLRLPFRPIEALLRLEVLDQTTNQRIEGFRATVTTRAAGGTADATRFVPKADQNPLPIPANRGDKLVVRVESPGYDPADPLEVTFDGVALQMERKVFLAAAMRFAGIELQVADGVGTPIPRIAVTAKLRENGVFRFLWRRRTSDTQGIYKLPNLQPGVYRIEVQAIDAKRIPTLHLTEELDIEFLGNEHIQKPIALAKAASIELRLDDGRGNIVGKDVRIELTHPDGEVRETVWRPIVDGAPDPDGSLSADHLTKDAHARLERCVRPGRYEIEVRLGDGPPIKRILDLGAGKISVVTMQLSR